MAEEAVMNLVRKTIAELNSSSQTDNLSCGSVMEYICILNSCIADWLSSEMNETSSEIIDLIHKCSLECLENAKDDQTV